MTAPKEIPHIDWNKVTHKAKMAEKVSHKGVTVTTDAVHFQIERHEHELRTRIVVFGEKSKRSLDEYLAFHPHELRTAFDLHRRIDATEADFARATGANFAVSGKFARKGEKLVVFHGSKELHFVLSDEVRHSLSRYVHHHFTM